MANNQVEEVKSKTDIVSLISEYLELKKAGRNYKANCPFHGEKTPSFFVSPELQIFKCFGCGASGDVFSFLERHESMEFSEALKYLADRVGVKLKLYKPHETSQKEKIIEMNKNALNFYQYALTQHKSGEKALNYLLKNRGLSLDQIKKFKIGFSPDFSSALIEYLEKKKKISQSDLVLGGLAVKTRKGVIDRFGGRIIFPLFDHRDNPVGFSGRVLPWDRREAGKYINSPETPAYHKSKILYGLNISKNEIRDKGFAIIVEGELDMISTYSAGFRNVVAIKGSALTEDQIRLLGRFCKKMILCLDADFAGDEASKRGAILASNFGFDVKVAEIKNYKDPDEIARKNPNEFKKILSNSKSIWDFLIDQVFAKFKNLKGETKAVISREITPLLALIEDKIVQSHYMDLVARRLSVSIEAVEQEVLKENKNKNSEKVAAIERLDEKKDRRQLLEEAVFANLILSKDDLFFDQEIKQLITTPFVKRTYDLICQKIKKANKLDIKEILEILPDEFKKGFSDIILSVSEKEDLNILIKELKILDIRQSLEKLAGEIREQEQSGNDTEVSRLQNIFTQLAEKLSKLEEES